MILGEKEDCLKFIEAQKKGKKKKTKSTSSDSSCSKENSEALKQKKKGTDCSIVS